MEKLMIAAIWFAYLVVCAEMIFFAATLAIKRMQEPSMVSLAVPIGLTALLMIAAWTTAQYVGQEWHNDMVVRIACVCVVAAIGAHSNWCQYKFLNPCRILQNVALAGFLIFAQFNT